MNSGNAGISNYNLLTPYRIIASASYVFREVKDTRLQRGFISADLEFVNYKGARFSAANENQSNNNLVNYYRSINEAIKETYKGNINFKLGGELKFNTWMFRLGGAFYGSPYADNVLNANRIIGSGGIGYRNKGFYIDLTYSNIINKDYQFPYLLNDKPNTFATQTGSRGNAMLTFGFKI